MSFSQHNEDTVIARYNARFNQHGYSPKSLGWDKGKQNLRFKVLCSKWDFNNKSVLDIGCGFADLYKYLQGRYDINSYHGIDLVPSLLNEAKQIYAHDPKVKLEVANCLNFTATQEYDFVIMSGLFNFKLDPPDDNYSFIEQVLAKSFSIAKIGVAADFLSNKVDYSYDYTFNSDPCTILEIAYRYSKNISLANDYFPFEFALFLHKDQSFKTTDTTYTTFIDGLKTYGN